MCSPRRLPPVAASSCAAGCTREASRRTSSPCAREPRAPTRVRTATPTRKQSASTSEQRQEALGRDPVRDQRGEWPHQGRDRLHALEQQQYRQVDGHDDEQPADDRARDEFACVFHGDGLSGLHLRSPRGSILRGERHYRREVSASASCARAGGPESCLFSSARFRGGLASPVRRSCSEIPGARPGQSRR